MGLKVPLPPGSATDYCTFSSWISISLSPLIAATSLSSTESMSASPSLSKINDKIIPLEDFRNYTFICFDWF